MHLYFVRGMWRLVLSMLDEENSEEHQWKSLAHFEFAELYLKIGHEEESRFVN